jgi:hypothetical protein
MILTLIGWVSGLFCAAMAAWCVSRMVLVREHSQTGRRLWHDALGAHNWFALLLWSGAAVAAFTLAGAVKPPDGALIAGGAAAVAVVWGRAWTPAGRHAIVGHFILGPREAWRQLAGREAGRAPEAPEGDPEAVVGEALKGGRQIPPVLQDPALGPVPEPAEIASSAVPVPAPYAALAAFIRDFEPADDMELRMFMDGHAAGQLAIADAWHDHADVLLNGVGLDPAHVAGVLEAGNSAAEHGSLLTQVHKRFGVIYAQVKEWISAHGPLPHKARDFLTGE